MDTGGILKRNILGKDRGGTEQSVVGSFHSFLAFHKVIDRIETDYGRQTNMAAGRQLYLKESRIPNDVGRLHEPYVPLVRRKFLTKLPSNRIAFYRSERKDYFTYSVACNQKGMRPGTLWTKKEVLNIIPYTTLSQWETVYLIIVSVVYHSIQHSISM